jgi:capsular polysaccharide transport system permease protein
MTQEAQDKLEQRLVAWRKNLTEQQWNSPDELFKFVEKMESTDLALAYRIMQRVRNLDPSELNISKLQQLKVLLFEQQPDLVKTSSVDKKVSSVMQQKSDKLVNLAKRLIGDKNKAFAKKPLVLFVVFPFLIFFIYQVFIASPRYESQAKIIIREPNGMATLDATMALMSGFGISSGNSDTELMKTYVLSNDMLIYLDKNLNINQHFQDTSFDYFSRLTGSASREAQLKYYQSRVIIEVDDKSQVINIKVQAFEPEFAHKLSQAIVARAEWYINEIGHNLAKEQLKFVQQEHELVQVKLQKAKSQLLDFQRRYDLLDPEAEGMALQQITYKLEAEVAAQQAELRALRSSMSDDAPLVLKALAQLDSLREQLDNERSRLTDQSSAAAHPSQDKANISEILAKFSDFKINLELALRSYTSSQVSLEKSRIEAYRQLKYLVVVESSTLPEDATYPSVVYNISLFLLVQLMLFGIGKIILATVEELR